MSYNDFIYSLSKSIKDRSIKHFQDAIGNFKRYENYLLNDNKNKEDIINTVFKSNNEELFEVVLDFFKIQEDIPEYDRISDLLYTEDKVINKKRNIYFIFEKNNFEEIVNDISMKDMYELSENDNVFEKLKTKLEDEVVFRSLTSNELGYILKKSIEYREYIDNEFKDILLDIKNNEGYVDSEMDCYKLLCEYLGHKPSKWEVKLLSEILI